MSDGFLFLLVLAAGLGLLYLWLRGWWFAGGVVTPLLLRLVIGDSESHAGGFISLLVLPGLFYSSIRAVRYVLIDPALPAR